MAALSAKGQLAIREMTSFYLANAKIVKTAMEGLGFECYGGQNSPYVWIRVSGFQMRFQLWLVSALRIGALSIYWGAVAEKGV